VDENKPPAPPAPVPPAPPGPVHMRAPGTPDQQLMSLFGLQGFTIGFCVRGGDAHKLVSPVTYQNPVVALQDLTAVMNHCHAAIGELTRQHGFNLGYQKALADNGLVTPLPSSANDGAPIH